MIAGWWLIARAWLAAVPAQVWIGLIGLLALGAFYAYAYNAGYSSADANWRAVIQRERDQQTKAIKDASEQAWRQIDRLNTELEERNDLISQLNAEGDKDPDAAGGGVGLDSVRRINRSRKTRP